MTGVLSKCVTADVLAQSVLGEVALRARRLAMMSSRANEMRLGVGWGGVGRGGFVGRRPPTDSSGTLACLYQAGS